MSFLFEKKTQVPPALLASITAYIEENYVKPHNIFPVRKMQETEVCESCAMPSPSMAPRAAFSLADFLREQDAGFSETLLKLIDKTGQKDSVVYKKAGLTKQHFSKIRNNPNYNPTKATALSLALALELDLEQTKDLIGRAGYALTNSSKFDLIIRYFIEHRIFDIVQINMALFELDQPLLGS